MERRSCYQSISNARLSVPLPCFHRESSKGTRADEWDVLTLVSASAPELAQPLRLSGVYAYGAGAVEGDVFESCEE